MSGRLHCKAKPRRNETNKGRSVQRLTGGGTAAAREEKRRGERRDAQVAVPVEGLDAPQQLVVVPHVHQHLLMWCGVV